MRVRWRALSLSRTGGKMIEGRTCIGIRPGAKAESHFRFWIPGLKLIYFLQICEYLELKFLVRFFFFFFLTIKSNHMWKFRLQNGLNWQRKIKIDLICKYLATSFVNFGYDTGASGCLWSQWSFKCRCCPAASLMDSVVMWLASNLPKLRLSIPRCCEWDIYCSPYCCTHIHHFSALDRWIISWWIIHSLWHADNVMFKNLW